MTPEFVAKAIASEVKRAKTLSEACDYLEQSAFPVELIEAGRKRYLSEVVRITVMRRPAAVRPRERQDWYPGPDESDVFWPRLRNYLTTERRWDPSVIRDLDDASTRVVSLLAPPGQDTFGTRGLVLGYVQSGKTANFTAVISKAADAGYQLFIVLSGLHNALRRQTQERLDTELVRLRPRSWYQLTGLDDDFTDRVRNAEAYLSQPDNRLLAVIKKNPAPLSKLLRWVKTASGGVLRNVPVLVIDDEADQASINTRAFEDKRSRIYALITDLLATFPKCAYVGYTATPFANVLSDPGYPGGLYPKDFIVDLPEPAAYFGSRKIFGTPGDALEDGLDMIRIIPDKDAESVMPKSRSSRDSFQPGMTDALRASLHWFWLACAVRLARGHVNQHMGMLIHTTVYTDAHKGFRPLVEVELHRVSGLLAASDPQLLADLRAIWDRETAAVTAERMGEKPVPWDEVVRHLPTVFAKNRVTVDNARSEDRLYYPKEGGSIQVVIGGNTLSRGLTLEGLMVSYFMRATTYYDTLMQMGRWFGYRFGYSDLPRLWMTEDLAAGFQHIAMVEQEIREDVARYAREDITPLDVGVNIQTHSTMAITSDLKMTHAVTAKMTFARAVKQTTYFRHLERDWLESNTAAARTLLQEAHARVSPELVWGRHTLYRAVDVAFIRTFLESYRIHERHHDMQPKLLRAYIDAQAREGRLLHWNVAVASQGGAAKKTWSGLLPGDAPVTLITRSRMQRDGDADLKAIMSSVDRAIDFGFAEAPKVGRFLDWANEQKIHLPDSTTSFTEWCFDHRSPLGADQDLSAIDPARGLRTPLLLLYPIDRDSDPGYPSTEGQRVRAPLGAAAHIVGMALVFPQSTRQTPQDYVTVDLSHVEREEPELEEEEAA